MRFSFVALMFWLMVSFSGMCHGQEDSIEIRGEVHASDGKPVSGAKVWFDTRFWDRPESELLEAVTDEDGGFLLSLSMERLRYLVHGSSLFVYHPDYQIEWFMATNALKGEMHHCEVTLRRSEGQKVRVVDREGTPLSDIGVSPRGLVFDFKGNRMARYLPDKILDKLEVVTGESGIVHLNSVSPGNQFAFRLRGEDIPDQYFHIDQRKPDETDSKDEPLVTDIPLAETGSFSFEFQIDGVDVPEERVRVHWSWVHSSIGEAFTSGQMSRMVMLDEVTKVQGVVKGIYDASFSGIQESGYVADWPNFRVSGFRPDHYVIPLVKGIRFRTRLVEEETGEPLAGLRTTLLFGDSMQSVDVISDEQGFVQGNVLPGRLWLQIPYEYDRGIPTQRTVFEKYQVPNQEEFTVDDVRVPMR